MLEAIVFFFYLQKNTVSNLIYKVEGILLFL